MFDAYPSLVSFFPETSCTVLMRRQDSFHCWWRLGNTASHLHQMRLFSKPCQRCWTALIQLRFTSKQDLMCLRVSWLERTEAALRILNSLFTVPQAEVLIWTDILIMKTFPPKWLFDTFRAVVPLYFSCAYKNNILHI